ncbi:MAG: MBL fold metallo-hydrolase [Christensenellaceae bacterium]|nr:MBL fold metallo-hydrolase [Christensenellaceae bacterium]
MRVYYLDHSGFAVELQDRLLIFDYFNFKPDNGGFAEGVVPAGRLREYKEVYFFASHAHADHFKKGIFSMAGENVKYILSSDIRTPEDLEHVSLDKGDRYTDDFLSVYAGGSTDIGVSFVIEAAGKKIFHAGDLNCWHWTTEWSDAEEQAARDAYHAELDDLAEYLQRIDLAFLPVDSRMKGIYDEGARTFASRFCPKHIIPMHCWGDYPITARFAGDMAKQGIKAFSYTQRGAEFVIE